MQEILLLYQQVVSSSVQIIQRANQQPMDSTGLSESIQTTQEMQLKKLQELCAQLTILCQRITTNGLQVGYNNCAKMLLTFKEMFNEMLRSEDLPVLLRTKLSQVIALLLCLTTVQNHKHLFSHMQQILQAKQGELIKRLPLLSFIPQKMIEANLRTKDRIQIKGCLLTYSERIAALYERLLQSQQDRSQVLTGIKNWAECSCVRFMLHPSIVTKLLQLDQLLTIEKLTAYMVRSKKANADWGYVKFEALAQQIPAITTIIQYIYENSDKLTHGQHGKAFLKRISTLLVQVPDLINHDAGKNLLEYYAYLFTDDSMQVSSISFSFWTAFIPKIRQIKDEQMSMTLQDTLRSLFQNYTARIQVNPTNVKDNFVKKINSIEQIELQNEGPINIMQYRRLSQKFFKAIFQYFTDTSNLDTVFDKLNIIYQAEVTSTPFFIQKSIYLLKLILETNLDIEAIEDRKVCKIGQLINKLMSHLLADQKDETYQVSMISFFQVLMSIGKNHSKIVKKIGINPTRMIQFCLINFDSEDELLADEAALLFQQMQQVISDYLQYPSILLAFEMYLKCNNLTGKRRAIILEIVLNNIQICAKHQQRQIFIDLIDKMIASIRQIKKEQIDYESKQEDKRLYFILQAQVMLSQLSRHQNLYENVRENGLKFTREYIKFICKVLKYLTQNKQIPISRQKLQLFSYALSDIGHYLQESNNEYDHDYLSSLDHIINFVFTRGYHQNNFSKYSVFLDNIHHIQYQMPDIRKSLMEKWASQRILEIEEFTLRLMSQDYVELSCMNFFVAFHTILFNHNSKEYLRKYEENVFQFVLNYSSVHSSEEIKRYIKDFSSSSLLEGNSKKQQYYSLLLMTMDYNANKLQTLLEEDYKGCSRDVIQYELCTIFPLIDDQVKGILKQLSAAMFYKEKPIITICLTRLKKKMTVRKEKQAEEKKKNDSEPTVLGEKG